MTKATMGETLKVDVLFDFGDQKLEQDRSSHLWISVSEVRAFSLFARLASLSSKRETLTFSMI